MAPPRKRSCPICKGPLREEPVEGVTADLCAEHGLWLDKAALRKIVERIKVTEMTKARRVLRMTESAEITKTAMTQGVLSRWWKRF